MDAKELRIDNLVLDSTGNTHRVEGVYPNRDYSKWSGIPLTEEWLVSFGFTESCEIDEDQEEFYIFTKNSISIYNSAYSNQFYLDSNGVVFGFTGESKIDYVHQLQNLYFALTGQEITINE